MRASTNPVTDEDRRRVRELHAAGMGRNAIGREIGRSGRTVSKIAEELGLSFDRSKAIVATEARKADAAALRAEEMLGALQDAKKIREQLFAPTVAFNFGGRDNTYAEKELDRPTFEQQRSITQAWSALIEKSVRLAEHDTEAGTEGARSMIGQLAAGLRVADRKLREEDGDRA